MLAGMAVVEEPLVKVCQLTGDLQEATVVYTVVAQVQGVMISGRVKGIALVPPLVALSVSCGEKAVLSPPPM